MNDPNVLETNPTRPGYVNPVTHAVNPGYTAFPTPVPSFDPSFSNSKVYALNDVVTFGGNRYVSLANANVSHTPDITPASWRLTNIAPAPPPVHAPAPLPATLPDVTTRVGHLETLARSFFERIVAVEAKHKAIHDGTK